MPTVAAGVVFLAGTYLLALGFTAFIQPNTAKRFLEGHASTARAHALELALRLLIGGAFVLTAPAMMMARLFSLIGWILIVTTAILAVLPWRVHQRFAKWSVPMATQQMALLGVGALLGGAGVLVALFGPHWPG